MHILLTHQEIYISCCCFFSSHNQGMFLPSTNSLGLETLHLPLKIVAECSNEHECMMYNLILIATNSTPSAPVVYAPSAFFLPETYKDHVVPLRLHNSWREEEITLFWGCGPFLLRAWRRLQRLFQKVHSVCAANYEKQRLKKRFFFIEVARLNLVWHKQCTGGNIRAQTTYFVFWHCLFFSS